MNLPNKLTVARLVMSVLIIILLLFPFHEIGIDFPQFIVTYCKSFCQDHVILSVRRELTVVKCGDGAGPGICAVVA